MNDVRPNLHRSQAALGAAGLVCLSVAVSGLASSQDKPTGPTPSCVTESCHAGITNRRVMHGPAVQEKCEACHLEVDATAHSFALPGDPAGLCGTCHPMQNRTYAHEPVVQGNCTGCHDPHGSDHAMMLIADPTQGLCLSCHRETADDSRPFVHGPVASGACILCHEAHSAWHPALLTEPPRKLCLGCHAELEPDPLRDRYRHEPVEDDCLACHDAHASDARYHLHEEAPDLCFRCHESTRIALQTASVVHGAVTVEKGCVVCHAAHYSSLPALQRAEEIDLCLSCHDEPMTTAESRDLLNMAQLLAENPDHHGPIREGACTACHFAHASEEPQLLRQAYPPEFYAPYEPERYALCFECHLPQLVQDRRGTGLTGFRDGDLNLHWLHVNREKGRTCRACHEVHASRNPFHMRDSVPFGTGGWALEIRFVPSERGGSCAPGCHKSTTYEREPDPGLPVGGLLPPPEEDQP